MTKQQFISGTPFRVKGIHNTKGSTTYKFEDGSISKQIRSSIDERILTDDYHLNVTKIGKVQFEGLVFVMDKKVVVKYRFEDLQEFVQEA